MDPTTLSMLEQAIRAIVELRGMRASVAELARAIALLTDRAERP